MDSYGKALVLGGGAVAALGALLWSLRARADDGEGGSAGASKPSGASPGTASPAAAAATLGLSPGWQTFLAAVAHHESRGHLDAQNLSPSEASGAAALYDAPANKWLRDCANPRAWYVWGTGGWYGLPPASAMRAFKDTPLACADPSSVIFDPIKSTAAAVGYAQRLFNWSSWDNSPKTWRALNRGWASPGAMDDVKPDTDARFDKALTALGVPLSWADELVEPLPAGWEPYPAVVAAEASA